MLIADETEGKTHQHPNLDLGGNLVRGTFTATLLLGSTLSASGSDSSWYLGAMVGNCALTLLGTFFGLGMETSLWGLCIRRTAAVIDLISSSNQIPAGQNTMIMPKAPVQLEVRRSKGRLSPVAIYCDFVSNGLTRQEHRYVWAQSYLLK